MRGGYRARSADDEEESAFISMTDMTVGFLFVIMILLAFFATQIAPRDTVPRSEYEKVLKESQKRKAQLSLLSGNVAELQRLRRELAARNSNPIERYNFRVAKLRGNLLEGIKRRIKEADPSIEVEISRNRDALEFKGDGLFPSASNVPTAVGKHKMEVIAGLLKQDISCFALSEYSKPAESCNPALALIDSIQVEGHTDSSGPDVMNMDLSSRRGSSVYAIMATAAPDLLSFLNLRGQPVLSVAGYGEGRPIADNDTVQGRDANRRIDLRFIMFAPTEERFVPQKVEDIPRLIHLFAGEAQP